MTRTCDHCAGRNYVRTADGSVDACPACTARAEAEWRIAQITPTRPVPLLVAAKGMAA